LLQVLRIDDDELVLLDLVALDDVLPLDALAAHGVDALVADGGQVPLVEQPEVELLRAALGGVQRHRDLEEAEADRPAPDAAACPARGATPRVAIRRVVSVRLGVPARALDHAPSAAAGIPSVLGPRSSVLSGRRRPSGGAPRSPLTTRAS